MKNNAYRTLLAVILSMIPVVLMADSSTTTASTLNSSVADAQLSGKEAEARAVYSASAESIRLQLTQAGLKASDFIPAGDQPPSQSSMLTDSLSSMAVGFGKAMTMASRTLQSIVDSPRLSYNVDKIVALVGKISVMDRNAAVMGSTYARQKCLLQMQVMSLLQKIIADSTPASAAGASQDSPLSDDISSMLNDLHEYTPIDNGRFMEIIQRVTSPLSQSDRERIAAALEQLAL